MSLLVPLILTVVVLAASVIATRVCEGCQSPRVDEHGYRVGRWQY